jgi:hypothetical protein
MSVSVLGVEKSWEFHKPKQQPVPARQATQLSNNDKSACYIFNSGHRTTPRMELAPS